MSKPYTDKWYSERWNVSTSLNVSRYGKDIIFSIKLFNNWGLSSIKWIPKVHDCEWSYWDWSWLFFSIHINKHGQSK